MDASEFEQTVGGHNSHVNFAVLVVVSLGCSEAIRAGSVLQLQSTAARPRLPLHVALLIETDGGKLSLG